MVRLKAILEISFEIIGRGKMKKTPQKEENQRYFFVKTFETSGGWKAMIADNKVLQENGSSAEDVIKASKVEIFNTVRLRGGVHLCDGSRLTSLLNNCKTMGMDKSSEALQRAIDVLNEKNGTLQNQVVLTVAPKQAM